MNLINFSQSEYSRVLDSHRARPRGLTQTECENLLMGAGATRQQAKNGAYVYLHHGNNVKAQRRGSKAEYNQLLSNYGATTRQPRECIRYLEKLGFSYGQAKTAVYQYRVARGLIGR